MASRGLEHEPPDGEGFDERREAMRRTRLAGERTYLAWWRTGLAAFVVSLGAGRLVPAVAGGPQTLYTLVGVLFAGLGIILIAYGRHRGREFEEAVSEGRYRRADERLLTLVTAFAGLGGVILIVLIFIGR